MQGYFCDSSKIYFPQLSASKENLGGLQPGFLWLLMLMSLLLLVRQEIHHKPSWNQTERPRYDTMILVSHSDFYFFLKEKQTVFSLVPLSLFPQRRKDRRRGDIFQIWLFSSASLFQKSQTTWYIRVSGHSELLKLLKCSSLSSPQNCFIVVWRVCLNHFFGCWVICFF